MNQHSTTLLATEETPRPGDSYVQSFARGLAVLRSFGAQAPQQTLSEVAERAKRRHEWNAPVVWPLAVIVLVLVSVIVPAVVAYRRRERGTARP